MASAAAKVETRTWVLQAETELRFDVSAEHTLTVVLKENTAEMFGIELAAEYEYKFSSTKAAVFTWYGCTIETTGWVSSIYVAQETPMKSYVNTHAQLEARRDKALQALQAGRTNITGPRVMVVGEADSGKSTLANILAAYAVRLGRCPTFVDLDVGQGMITVPGGIAAAALDSNSMSVEEGFSLTAPLVLFYGHTSLQENPELFKKLVGRMAECLKRRVANDIDASASGAIFNTCGWVEGLGLELLAHAITVLDIDVVLVMKHDRLYADMVATLPRSVAVINLPRSGAGVALRSSQYRRASRDRRCREYFYGGGGGAAAAAAGGAPALSPAALHLDFNDVSIFRVGGQTVSDAMLPVGHSDSSLGPLQVNPFYPSSDLLHTVLAVCHPVLRQDGTMLGGASGLEGDRDSAEAAQELLNSNAAGFVYVTEVDMDKRRLAVLSPCPGSLPSRFLIAGTVKWQE
ncbi:unnamed protein product [Ectocarpus sp. 6 AP-2014]